LVGETYFLRHPVAAFVRLREACRLGEMTEVPVPTRFMFILLGTAGNGAKYQQIGRAMGTLFSDEPPFLSFLFISPPVLSTLSFEIHPLIDGASNDPWESNFSTDP
uniref:Band_3_cyto domain-containing protein n=1 Tax=Hydatigena taeniaeformis TaxID=6205 RepID=A0A0R3WV99_HYDTA